MQGYMEMVRNAHPDFDETSSWPSFYYENMVEALGNVAYIEQLGSYEGDYFVLYDDDIGYGVLIFGYGSCSGCDALEACDTLHQAAELLQSLDNAIIRFDDWTELMKWIDSRDGLNSHWWDIGDYDKIRKNVQQVVEENRRG